MNYAFANQMPKPGFLTFKDKVEVRVLFGIDTTIRVS